MSIRSPLDGQIVDILKAKLCLQRTLISPVELITNANSIYTTLASSDCVNFLKKYDKFRNTLKDKCAELILYIEETNYMIEHPPVTTKLLNNINIVLDIVQNIENNIGEKE